MYKNENSYIDAKRKNSTTKIDDDSTKNFLCFKSQEKKLSKNYIKTKRILHKTTNKKESNRYSRITFFESKKKIFDDKKKSSANKKKFSTNKKKFSANKKKLLTNQKKFFNMQNHYRNGT